MKVCVIGSGLAAVGAIEGLVARGVCPVVLDVGKTLDATIEKRAKSLAERNPSFWTRSERESISDNLTTHAKDLPRKLVFGSDYFYGSSLDKARLNGKGDLPPFSYALGGLSIGWGSAALLPDECDLHDWPVASRDLLDYCRLAMKGKPLVEFDDDLSKKFPRIYDCDCKIINSTFGNDLLDDISRSNIIHHSNVLFGRSRLMLQLDPQKNNSCKFCGQCMLGCVYDSIYKASYTIADYQKNGSIQYNSGYLVDSLVEKSDGIHVLASYKGRNVDLRFDKVFLAAGAVNSTRIVLNSEKNFNKKINLKSTVGFVLPLIRFKSSKLEWPNVCTLPEIFLEFKEDSLSDHWIHCQISAPNELLFKRFSYNAFSSKISDKLKRKFLEHLVVATGNLHSDHGNGYSLWLEEASNGTSILNYERNDPASSSKHIRTVVRRLTKLGIEFGCLGIPAAVMDSTRGGGFHVGGTIPMRHSPQQAMESDVFGVPVGWTKLHVVDSSVFPSLPGTTIGILAMGNACRITSSMKLD